MADVEQVGRNDERVCTRDCRVVAFVARPILQWPMLTRQVFC